MNIYRQLYEQHYGPIPVDEGGRTYDIHHIDGNHKNNAIDNLMAVTLQEHYNIHYAREDWAACSLILMRMEKSVEETSACLKILGRKRVDDKTHNFLGSALQNRRVLEGTHPFLGGYIQGITSRDRVSKGTHNFLGGEVQKITAQKRIKENTHNCLISYTCPHCGKTGKGPVMKRHHFDHCRN